MTIVRNLMTSLHDLFHQRAVTGAARPWVRPTEAGLSAGAEIASDHATDHTAELLRACRSLSTEILEQADEFERCRALPESLMLQLKKLGFFRMTMPKEWGGFELTPVDQYRVIKELAQLDASVAWCVMIGSDGGYFSGFMDPKGAREIYADVDAITAAGVFPSGVAHRVSGGYKVEGKWRFGSGCKSADWVAAGCIVHRAGVPVMQLNGLPQMRICMIPKGSIEIADTWTTTGLRGSGSHDWSVSGVHVPLAHAFDLLQPRTHRTGPLYQLPGMFMYNFPGVAVGVATRAISTFTELAAQKIMPFKVRTSLADDPYTQRLMAEVTRKLCSAEAFYLTALQDIWTTICHGKTQPSTLNPFHGDTAYDMLTVDQRIRIRLAMNGIHEACVQIVDQLYHAAGGASIYSKNIFDRLFRDIHTINQHVIVSNQTYQTAGKMLVGLPPEEPFF